MRAAVTGCGLLTVLGVGAAPVFEKLLAAPAGGATEVPGFDPADYLGTRGLRHFDRTALLLACAARLALDESGLSAETYGHEGLGVVVGSTHGSIQAIAEFDQEAVAEGPKYVNPQHFPNTVISAPAGRLAVLFEANGLNTTVSTGTTSALEAFGYAGSMLQNRNAQALLCGSGLGRSAEIAAGYANAGRIALSDRGCTPFGPRDATTLGEGAAAFTLESVEDAAARGARPLAVVTGFGSAFSAHGSGLERALRAALDDAGIEAKDVGCVISSASGGRSRDLEEGRALAAVFGSVPVTAPKAAAGECLEASGAIAVAIAVEILRTGRIPPIAGLGETAPELNGLRLVRDTPLDAEVRHVLIPDCDPEGHCAALVVSKAP